MRLAEWREAAERRRAAASGASAAALRSQVALEERLADALAQAGLSRARPLLKRATLGMPSY